MNIIKKDGQRIDFDSNRIYQAVKHAINNSSNKEMTEEEIKTLESEAERIGRTIETIVANEVSLVREGTDIESAEIRDQVEGLLMALHKDGAVSYIEHRKQQEMSREGMVNVEKSVYKVISKDKRVVNENANKDSNHYPVVRDLTAGSVAKALGLQMLPKKVANSHIKGDIHYHDLDYQPYSPMTNCCLINFKDMFENGTRIGNARIESPKSIDTAVALTAQIIANVSSNQYGGCSFNRMDEVLAPYAKMNFDKYYTKHKADFLEYSDDHELAHKIAEERAYRDTKKDIYDSIQSLEYEVNTLYNSNGQTAFFSVGFGLGTNWFEREIQKAIFENRMAGLGGHVAIFPKLIFTIKDGLNLKPTDPNYDIKQLALECTSKCIYPDILNYDRLCEITGNFKVPMGCRSFLHQWMNDEGIEETDGRFNLGVTTLNLPRVAIQANGDKKKFWRILNQRLNVIKEACEYRIKRTQDAKPLNAPILYRDGAFGRLGNDGDVWDLMKDDRGTISVGYIGLYEVGTMFYGPEWETNPEAKEFTLDILKHMSEKTNEWSNEFGVHASVYATPSESLTDRFCRMDQEKFGMIENVTDKDYYTNSFHYDTRKHITPFEKIDFESEYLDYTPGGFICYVELANARQNLKALEDVWDYSYDKVGYFAVNTPIDKCFDCQFNGDFNTTDNGFECPECGNHDPEKCNVTKRTCGYLGNPQVRPMAHGRQKEIQSRVKHDV